MPQLWTETFVSQYFWLLLILLTFYFFIATKVIPNIANAIKARQIVDNKETAIENISFVNDKSIALFGLINKQNFEVNLSPLNWETIQEEWLTNNPENDTTYWIETNLSEESKQQLENDEDFDLSLEEFLQSEENKPA